MASEREFKQFLKRVLDGVAQELRTKLVKAAPANTGRLRNSIKVIAKDDSLLITMVDYGKNVEFGSNPHTIKAKGRKALKFKKGGKTVFAKSVQHPGTRPTFFIRSTLFNDFPDIIRKEIKNQAK